MSERTRVLVAGTSGLAGALAARLVWTHPQLELAAVSGRSEVGTRLDELHPRHRVPLPVEELDLDRIEELDAAVVAYPHGAAAPLVAELRGLGVVVVDLSADFRLRDLPSYERWYGPHGDPDLLEGAVYGLTELNRGPVREAELVANPGCYPTAALLALAPLAEAGLIADVVVSAASGVSGAGRGAAGFVETTENFTPYGIEGHRHYPEIQQELAGMGAHGPLTFIPHLLPIDQGLLASCFVTPTREVEADELRDLYAERYAGEPFVELVDAPPGVRDVRETNHCRIHAAVEETGGRVLAFAAIDNLWKGAAGQAIQNLNLMLGLDETEGLVPVSAQPATGAPASFFRSRWVTPPEGTEELDAWSLAPGFRAAGVACGLKEGGVTDLGLLVCDADAVVSALLLTSNAAAAAPVRVCRERCDQARLVAVVVNSGNANAATGERGYADAVSMQEAAAGALGVEARRMAVAETGTIGVPLDIDSVRAGIAAAADGLSGDGAEAFARSIMTTDAWPKRCTVRAGGVTLSAQAKGAGMMQPGFATLLCFIQTDAAVEAPEPQLRAAVAGSLERISVDGQQSTNDAVLLQATGESGRPLPDGLLDAVLLQLALEITADGEGASRVARVEVDGAANTDEAERVARAIANSPLVKTALYGHDPNWGRIAQAAGMALAGEELHELGPDDIDADGLGSDEPEAEIAIRLARGDASAHLYFSDLTPDYVKLNSEYTT